MKPEDDLGPDPWSQVFALLIRKMQKWKNSFPIFLIQKNWIRKNANKQEILLRHSYNPDMFSMELVS